MVELIWLNWLYLLGLKWAENLRWFTLICYNSVTTSYVTYFDIMVTFRKCFFRLEVVKAKGEHFGACPGPWAGTQLLTPVITPLDSQNLEYPWIYIFLEYLGLPWTFYLADLYETQYGITLALQLVSAQPFGLGLWWGLHHLRWERPGTSIRSSPITEGGHLSLGSEGATDDLRWFNEPNEPVADNFRFCLIWIIGAMAENCWRETWWTSPFSWFFIPLKMLEQSAMAGSILATASLPRFRAAHWGEGLGGWDVHPKHHHAPSA